MTSIVMFFIWYSVTIKVVNPVSVLDKAKTTKLSKKQWTKKPTVLMKLVCIAVALAAVVFNLQSSSSAFRTSRLASGNQEKRVVDFMSPDQQNFMHFAIYVRTLMLAGESGDLLISMDRFNDKLLANTKTTTAASTTTTEFGLTYARKGFWSKIMHTRFFDLSFLQARFGWNWN